MRQAYKVGLFVLLLLSRQNFTKKGLTVREYGYDEFATDMRVLADKVTDFKADAILFVARGGATMAHFLAMHTGIRKMYAVNTRSYEGQTKLGTPIVDELPNLVGANKVIVADEIVDTGETLKIVIEKLQTAYPNVEFKTVALFQRESAAVKADCYLHLTDEWVEFFWERDGGEIL
jgi:xanthine phosphoribosyltransferase